MHLADRLTLPAAYRARPYRGPADHPAMAASLARTASALASRYSWDARAERLQAALEAASQS